VERRGENAVIIKIEYPANMRERLRGDPDAELAVLREIAGQLKASNSKITYAHPNWIRDLSPPGPRTDRPLKTAPQHPLQPGRAAPRGAGPGGGRAQRSRLSGRPALALPAAAGWHERDQCLAVKGDRQSGCRGRSARYRLAVRPPGHQGLG